MFECCRKPLAVAPRGAAVAVQAIPAIPEGTAEKVETLKSSPTMISRCEAADELGRIPQAAHLSIPTLIQHAREDEGFFDPTFPVREACVDSLEGLAKALSKWGEGLAASVVKPLYDPPKLSAEGTQWYDRAAACWALGFARKAVTKAELDTMVAMVVHDEKFDVRRYAREGLEKLPPSVVLPAIESLVTSDKVEASQERGRVGAVWAMGCIQQAEAQPDLSKIIEHLDDPQVEVRKEAVLALAKFPQLAATTVPLINKMMFDDDAYFFTQIFPAREARIVALRKLAEAGSEDAKKALDAGPEWSWAGMANRNRMSEVVGYSVTSALTMP